MLHYFIGGLVGVFTPIVLLMTLLISIAFSQFKITRPQAIKNSGVFLILSVFFLVVFGMIVSSLYTPNTSFGPFSYFFYLLNLFFGLWLTGLFRGKIKLALLLPVFALLFVVESLHNVGPILASILVSNQDNVLWPVLVFSIGLMLPVALLVFLFNRLLQKFADKFWWNRVEVVVGIAYLLIVLFGSFIKHGG